MLQTILELTGDNEFVVETDSELAGIVPGYLENRRKDVQTAGEALNVMDFDKIKRIGHNMKGTGKGYGFDRISELGRDIEQAAKESNAVEIQLLLKELSAFLNKVKVVNR